MKNSALVLVTVIVVAVAIVSGTLAIVGNARSSTTLSATRTTGSPTTTTSRSTLTSINYTEVTVNNSKATAVPSSETGFTATNSTRVWSSMTPSPCTPYPGHDSTITVTQQNTTSTEQMVYDGVPCNFGGGSQPPSAILIPANTLVWTNFQLHENGIYSIQAGFDFLVTPEAMTANLTIDVYLNGKLNGTRPYAESNYPFPRTESNSSLLPPSNSSSNSIFSPAMGVPGVGISGQADSPVNLANTTITVAIVSDKPLWIIGWTPQDSQYGLSAGQLYGTYEWPDSSEAVPNLLPQPSITLSFELCVSGNYQ